MGTLLFGILPAIVALGVIALSIQTMLRAFGWVQLVLAVPAVLIATLSLWVLKNIFVDNSWPTFIPHVAITATIPLLLIQLYLTRRAPADAAAGMKDRQRPRHVRFQLICGLVLIALSIPPLVLMAREIAMGWVTRARYVERVLRHEPEHVGGELRTEIGGHVVSLEDDQPYRPNGDERVDGLVRILVDGKDYSTNGRVKIRLNSRDANRYWGYVCLMEFVDHYTRMEHVAVAQNLGRRFRTLTVSADGSVVEDEFDYNDRCDAPMRVLLISRVVPSPMGSCFSPILGSIAYPVIYPWISAALGLTWTIDA